MPFQRYAILGPGLLGGSIALALRSLRAGVQISMYGRRHEVLDKAMSRHLADRTSTVPSEVIDGAECVILATPIGVMSQLIKQSLHALSPEAIVTDVGSVKAPVVRELETVLADSRAHFVGSHPMAGSEKTGLDAAVPELFHGAACILTPSPHTNLEAMRKIDALWRLLGCMTYEMSPERHDQTVSTISHVPHLLAALLVQLAAEGRGEDGSDTGWMALAGGGFRDTTRIAAGPPEMWTEILLENAQAVEQDLERLGILISESRKAIRSHNWESLRELLTFAKSQREKLPLPRAAHAPE